MIALLQGRVCELDGSSIVLLTQGIGWQVFIPRSELYSIDQEALVYISYLWNQEQGPALYGFTTGSDRSFFQLVLTCPGVGPKLALSLLAQSSAQECVGAIMTTNHTALSKLKGIGTKKAEVLITHLKNKCDAWVPSAESGALGQVLRDVAGALTTLRYQPAEISRALEMAQRNQQSGELSFERLLRSALSVLAKSSAT